MSIVEVKTFLLGLLHMNESRLLLAGVPMLALLLIVALLIVVWQRTVIRVGRHDLARLKTLLREVQGTQTLEHKLDVILKTISSFISAPYLAFYVLDVRNQRYLLRAVSHPFEESNQMQPSHSGLGLPPQDVYLPPISIGSDHGQKSIEMVADGDVQLLLLRSVRKRAVIRIGPVEKVPRATHRKLNRFINSIDGIIDDLVESELDRLRTHDAALAHNAVKEIASITTDASVAMDILIRAFAGVSGGMGAIFVGSDGRHHDTSNGSDELVRISGLVEGDEDFRRRLYNIVGQRPYQLITRTDEEFYTLPDYISNLDLGALVVLQVAQRGLLLCFYDVGFDMDDFMRNGIHQIRILSDQLTQIATHYSAQRKLSRVYGRMLGDITNMVETLNPYTVGYSDMMMRYSLAIGKELELPEDVMVDLALAANVSNIGVLGLDMDLLTKEDTFTEFEYETMKLHCEIGASLIQVATGNQRAAKYVLHHHERMDGLGYPDGLKGRDIPIGARIIHVVQVFLAKINGRSWRIPQSFEQALDTLRVAAGNQLDPEVVEAFLRWYEQKRQNPMIREKSLGRCYEMLSTPISICKTCPAFAQPDTHCWTVGNVNCKAHGRDCESCFVKTEYLYRTSHPQSDPTLVRR